jgi:hypothetical protein
MIPWKTALLLTLVAAIAVPAQAEDDPTPVTYPSADGPCNIAYIYISQPRIDPHPECIGP